MQRIGLVGAGAMGCALAAGWRAGGHEVVSDLGERSARTRRLAAAAGVTEVAGLDAVVACDLVVSVVPPAAARHVALDVAAAAARTRSAPLVVDLNAVSPETLADIAATLGRSGLDLVDGSISGGPPAPGRPVRVYAAGPRTAEFTALHSDRVDLVTLGPQLGAASALKMCTAAMYKGRTALAIQAMLTARHHGVLAEFLADTARAWPDEVPRWPADAALAASKSARFVDEMTEIARTQAGAGLPAALYDGVAAAYARVARTRAALSAPEDVVADAPAETVLAGLAAPAADGPRAVLFDFSGTLFAIEAADRSLLGALGPGFVGLAAEMERYGGINGSTTPQVLPEDLADVWAQRDFSPAAHHAAYSGLSMRAGLTREQADVLYARGTSPEAWHPFPDTIRVLRGLRARGVPVAVVSNIGWDPRPVFARYGVDVDLDALVLSYEVGVEKPDPAIFRIACERLGVAPEHALMVGDNPDADGGCTALGIPFVQVAAHPRDRRPDELADAVRPLLDPTG